MPTAIAVTGPELVLPPLDRQTPTAAVLAPPGEQTLDAALVTAALLLERHGHLVVLYPAACSTRLARRLHTIRSLLESDRMALLPVALPPLGVAVLARQLRQLSVCGFSPGVLASAARLLAHYVYAGALLASVTRLDRVDVRLASHVKSWLPGVQFGVLAHPEPRVITVGREEKLTGPSFATHLTVAVGRLPADWVTGHLAHSWRVQGVAEVPLPRESAPWWGTAKLVEFAAAMPDPSMLYQLVSSVRRMECHWCGLELIGDRCAFCSSPVPGPPAAQVSGRRAALTRGPGPGPRVLPEGART
ncbi:hypothetical protein [Streptomyces sp. URMC 123]|uniref:hypothetical protein n=1 Tax=Streptomyces sp. URMC 123 TaxID=3423403 RepID=UPI003F1D3558